MHNQLESSRTEKQPRTTPFRGTLGIIHQSSLTNLAVSLPVDLCAPEARSSSQNVDLLYQRKEHVMAEGDSEKHIFHRKFASSDDVRPNELASSLNDWISYGRDYFARPTSSIKVLQNPQLYQIPTPEGQTPAATPNYNLFSPNLAPATTSPALTQSSARSFFGQRDEFVHMNLHPQSHHKRTLAESERTFLSSTRQPHRPQAAGTNGTNGTNDADETEMSISPMTTPELVRDTSNSSMNNGTGQQSDVREPVSDTDFTDLPDKPTAKHLTCFWWQKKGNCRYTEEDCHFAHHDTGLSAGPPSVKRLTCFWWRERGFCKFVEEDCLYAHYDTGLYADPPRGYVPAGQYPD